MKRFIALFVTVAALAVAPPAFADPRCADKTDTSVDCGRWGEMKTVAQAREKFHMSLEEFLIVNASNPALADADDLTEIPAFTYVVHKVNT